MRILLAAALLVLASTSADASNTRAGAGVPRGGRLAHSSFETVDDTHATLTFVLSTTSQTAREVIVPITLPDGMVATGLSLTMGDAPPLTGFAFARSSARDGYEDIVRQIVDPALLEYAGRGRLRLSVFPIARGTPARVTIQLTAIEDASVETRVDGEVSILAAPGLDTHDPYADYWPAHPSPSTELAKL